ncbi:hypothetical protein [Pseudomonas sp. P129]|uniref:hypothetical protein n=1 Tax=Pseudomonas sp. P129 TaxID=2823887 RepID=UPI001CE245B7|nr:hypothetical protein [Pseudomonas sp. P129]MCA5967428.1 hypothetical protein [Pseudomonas sp. P129]
MEYASWSETVIENLISEGIDPQLVRKIFNEEKKELESIYGGGDLTLVGVHFIKTLEPHDLDLQIAEDRLHGAGLDELSAAYSVTKDEARRRAIVGATKKTVTLGLFRGQRVDPSAPLDF